MLVLFKHFVIITINTLFNCTHIINCNQHFLIAHRFFETQDQLSKMLLFFSYVKFSYACRANCCFRYHKYYPGLHEDNIKIFAIFLL